MTPSQLKTMEAELERRGYRKRTTRLTSVESWAWLKTFGKEKDENNDVIAGYQVAFRVWDCTQFGQSGAASYGLDFCTSALGTTSRMVFTSNWEPICSIATFELMAAEFNTFTRKHLNNILQ